MELLMRIVDKHTSDHADYDKASQCGDVISICPDGWEWSDAERSNPAWIIIKADITQIEADALIEGGRPNELQWRRRVGINIDGLKTGSVLSRLELMERAF